MKTYLFKKYSFTGKSFIVSITVTMLAVVFMVLFSSSPALAAHSHSYTWGPYYESTHNSAGHRVLYYCNAGDGAIQVTGSYAPYSGCSTCTHSCSQSGVYTEAAHPHQQFRYLCTSSSCPKGNYNVPQYTGGYGTVSSCPTCNPPAHTTHTWQSNGSYNHVNKQHVQPQICSYSGCGATQNVTTSAPTSCTTCYPPHTTHTWVNNGSYSHVNKQHVQPQKCSYCGATQNVTTSAPTSCTTCYPPHTTHTWVNNGSYNHVNKQHVQPQICSYSGCGATQNVTTSAPTSCTTCYPPAHTHNWVDDGEPEENHNYNWEGHFQMQVCNYSGCPEGRTIYVSDPNCLPCDPIHNSILVLVDNSFVNEFNGSSAANSFMFNMEEAFIRRWGLYFDRTVGTASSSLPFNTVCSTGGSDVHCAANICANNQDCAAAHHKSFNYNLDWMKHNNTLSSNNKPRDYSAILLLTSSAACSRNGFVHSQTPRGMVNANGGYYAAVTTRPAVSQQGEPDNILTERSIQHELSHLYSASHCSSSVCIMNVNSAILRNDNYYDPDIWCNSCANMIESNRTHLQ